MYLPGKIDVQLSSSDKEVIFSYFDEDTDSRSYINKITKVVNICDYDGRHENVSLKDRGISGLIEDFKTKKRKEGYSSLGGLVVIFFVSDREFYNRYAEELSGLERNVYEWLDIWCVYHVEGLADEVKPEGLNKTWITIRKRDTSCISVALLVYIMVNDKQKELLGDGVYRIDKEKYFNVTHIKERLVPEFIDVYREKTPDSQEYDAKMEAIKVEVSHIINMIDAEQLEYPKLSELPEIVNEKGFLEKLFKSNDNISLKDKYGYSREKLFDVLEGLVLRCVDNMWDSLAAHRYIEDEIMKWVLREPGYVDILKDSLHDLEEYEKKSRNGHISGNEYFNAYQETVRRRYTLQRVIDLVNSRKDTAEKDVRAYKMKDEALRCFMPSVDKLRNQFTRLKQKEITDYIVYNFKSLCDGNCQQDWAAGMKVFKVDANGKTDSSGYKYTGLKYMDPETVYVIEWKELGGSYGVVDDKSHDGDM